MEYLIKLDQFEGPLDLLLHLISKAKIRIEDISITEITEQYLEYLDKMKEFDVEIASEFLIMAATLLQIKSRALLPKPSIEEDNESDPEQDLIRRLAEYKKYKEASIALENRERIYGSVFYKIPEEVIDEKDKEIQTLVEGDVDMLVAAFKSLMEKKRSEITANKVYPISRQPITINQRIYQLKRYFKTIKECYFSELFDEYYQRSDVVITFLALLEMLKANQICVYQRRQFEDIIIRRAT